MPPWLLFSSVPASGSAPLELLPRVNVPGSSLLRREEGRSPAAMRRGRGGGDAVGVGSLCECCLQVD